MNDITPKPKKYRVWRQRVTHRNWPVLIGTEDHPKQTLPEVSEFGDLESAKLDFTYWVIGGYELVRIDRDYDSGVCGSIAIYNEAMDEYR